ncbi:MAG: hypothetical protein HPY65_11410 [Syntrophaceae bacterium]|nr:hypothetical protein [Syntrophaceae bacterium]
MEKERIRVFVNDRPMTIYRGLAVKHALIAAGGDLYKPALDGDVAVRDENGFVLGLEGALHDGARLYVALPERR